MTLASQISAAFPALALRTNLTKADPGLHPDNLQAGVIALPSDVAQVSALLKFCNQHKITIVPQGGRTGLAGGAVSSEGQLILSTQNLNRIIEIDPIGQVVVVEAGVTLANLDAALQPHGLMAGIDLGARDVATIGGLISTNAGGIEAFRHGVMRARVSGLEAVLADGTIMSDLARVAKCNEGYDVKQLLIGAEGTLGIVTKAVIRLVPRPQARATALVVCPNLTAALALFNAVPTHQLLAFEYMHADYFWLSVADRKTAAFNGLPKQGSYFIVECEGRDDTEAQARLQAALEQGLEQGWVVDALIAKSQAEARSFWILREDSWCVDRALPFGLWYDVTVPQAKLEVYLATLEQGLAREAPPLKAYVIGHLGDGNVHLTIAGAAPAEPFKNQVDALVFGQLKAWGGSFSAEHGIGLEKRAALATYGDAGKLSALRAIKAALDPKGILNPGKVL
ncbi:MAG: FAD-binding oxidoreductase [Alphaproteobacteria bacterium]|nr:FAD-binding oxidoreductase [Alphaproteobacteria bacterium]